MTCDPLEMVTKWLMNKIFDQMLIEIFFYLLELIDYMVACWTG